jgi:hypothetical protein
MFLMINDILLVEVDIAVVVTDAVDFGVVDIDYFDVGNDFVLRDIQFLVPLILGGLS